MDNIQAQAGFAKLKDFVFRKKLMVGGLLGVLVIAFLGYTIYNAQPKSVASNIEVTFTGYDGYGVVSYNYDDVQKAVKEVAYQSVGFNARDVATLVAGDPIQTAELYANPKAYQKYTRAQAYIENVSFGFDRTMDLTNGDTITFTVNPGSTKSPIKKETKVFKVKGLEKIQTVTTKKLLEEFPVTFSGMNGYASISIPEQDGYPVFYISSGNDSGNYSNGDTVLLEVDGYYLENLKAQGKKLEEKTIEVKVSGLKELVDIPNLKDGFSKNDSYIKSNYENDEYYTYTLEKLTDHISYQNSSWEADSAQVYAVSVYKITEVRKAMFGDETTTTVKYNFYGYRYYIKPDGSLDLDASNQVSGHSTQDLAKLMAELDIEGYQEYSLATE